MAGHKNRRKIDPLEKKKPKQNKKIISSCSFKFNSYSFFWTKILKTGFTNY